MIHTVLWLNKKCNIIELSCSKKKEKRIMVPSCLLNLQNSWKNYHFNRMDFSHRNIFQNFASVDLSFSANLLVDPKICEAVVSYLEKGVCINCSLITAYLGIN